MSASRVAAWLAAGAWGFAPSTQASDASVDLYTAVEYGRQQVIAGAQYSGTDVLASDVRTVSGLSFGIRVEVARWVFGGDLGFGQVDGNLRHADASGPLTITYRGNSQSHFGAHVGRRLDPAWLAYAYLSEASRDFDVTLTDGSGTTMQADGQGILRFGVGAERTLRPWLSWRVTLGSARASFEGPTRGDPGREIEFGLGLVLTLKGEPR